MSTIDYDRLYKFDKIDFPNGHIDPDAPTQCVNQDPCSYFQICDFEEEICKFSPLLIAIFIGFSFFFFIGIGFAAITLCKCK